MAEKPDVSKIIVTPYGENGYKAQLGDVVAIGYGEDAAAAADGVVNRLLQELGVASEEVLVHKPGTVVIEVPKFTAGGAAAPATAKGSKAKGA
jgi:hypothetical protein